MGEAKDGLPGSQLCPRSRKGATSVPRSGPMPTCKEGTHSPPSHPPEARRCHFKQQPAGWHARRVSQRPVPADSPTGSLLLPQPSPHTNG